MSDKEEDFSHLNEFLQINWCLPQNGSSGYEDIIFKDGVGANNVDLEEHGDVSGGGEDPLIEEVVGRERTLHLNPPHSTEEEGGECTGTGGEPRRDAGSCYFLRSSRRKSAAPSLSSNSPGSTGSDPDWRYGKKCRSKRIKKRQAFSEPSRGKYNFRKRSKPTDAPFVITKTKRKKMVDKIEVADRKCLSLLSAVSVGGELASLSRDEPLQAASAPPIHTSNHTSQMNLENSYFNGTYESQLRYHVTGKIVELSSTRKGLNVSPLRIRKQLRPESELRQEALKERFKITKLFLNVNSSLCLVEATLRGWKYRGSGPKRGEASRLLKKLVRLNCTLSEEYGNLQRHCHQADVLWHILDLVRKSEHLQWKLQRLVRNINKMKLSRMDIANATVTYQKRNDGSGSRGIGVELPEMLRAEKKKPLRPTKVRRQRSKKTGICHKPNNDVNRNDSEEIVPLINSSSSKQETSSSGEMSKTNRNVVIQVFPQNFSKNEIKPQFPSEIHTLTFSNLEKDLRISDVLQDRLVKNIKSAGLSFTMNDLKAKFSLPVSEYNLTNQLVPVVGSQPQFCAKKHSTSSPHETQSTQESDNIGQENKTMTSFKPNISNVLRSVGSGRNTNLSGAPGVNQNSANSSLPKNALVAKCSLPDSSVNNPAVNELNLTKQRPVILRQSKLKVYTTKPSTFCPLNINNETENSEVDKVCQSKEFKMSCKPELISEVSENNPKPGVFPNALVAKQNNVVSNQTKNVLVTELSSSDSLMKNPAVNELNLTKQRPVILRQSKLKVYTTKPSTFCPLNINNETENSEVDKVCQSKEFKMSCKPELISEVSENNPKPGVFPNALVAKQNNVVSNQTKNVLVTELSSSDSLMNSRVVNELNLTKRLPVTLRQSKLKVYTPNHSTSYPLILNDDTENSEINKICQSKAPQNSATKNILQEKIGTSSLFLNNRAVNEHNANKPLPTPQHQSQLKMDTKIHTTRYPHFTSNVNNVAKISGMNNVSQGKEDVMCSKSDQPKVLNESISERTVRNEDMSRSGEVVRISFNGNSTKEEGTQTIDVTELQAGLGGAGREPEGDLLLLGDGEASSKLDEIFSSLSPLHTEEFLQDFSLNFTESQTFPCPPRATSANIRRVSPSLSPTHLSSYSHQRLTMGEGSQNQEEALYTVDNSPKQSNILTGVVDEMKSLESYALSDLGQERGRRDNLPSQWDPEPPLNPAVLDDTPASGRLPVAAPVTTNQTSQLLLENIKYVRLYSMSEFLQVESFDDLLSPRVFLW